MRTSPRSTTPTRRSAAPPRPASTASSPSAPTSRTAAERFLSPSATTASSRSSASTRTRRERRRESSWRSCATCSGTRGPSRWARPASTGSATTRRAMRSGDSSPPSSSSRPSSESRSWSTHAPPTGTRSTRSRISQASSSCTASRRRGCCQPRSSGTGTSRSPATRRSRKPSTFVWPRPRFRRSASSPRPTRRTSRRSRCAAGGTSRRTSFTRSPRLLGPGARSPRGSSGRSSRTRPSASPCHERAAEEGVRPALPARPEHPRRDRTACRARLGGRRPRDRPRSGSAHALPGRPRPARPRDRDRPRARAGPGGPRGQRRRRLRGRAPDRAAAGGDEARCEPSLQRRDPADRGEPRRPAARRALVRDGAAGGRRPALREAGDEGLRSRLGARAACLRAHRLPSGLAVGVPASAQRRLGARRLPSQGASGGLRSRERSRQRRVRPPPQDAFQLARAGGSRITRRGGDRPSGRDPCRGAGPRRLRRTGGDASVKAAAPAKINLALVVGPTRDDGKHEVLTVLQRIELADRIELVEAQALEVEGFPEDTLVRAALEELASSAGVEPRWRVRIEKKVPVAAGLGGGSSDAATALRLANGTLEEPLADEELLRIAAGLGSDVPFFLAAGPQLGSGNGSRLESLHLPQDFFVVILLPSHASKTSTADVYAAFDARHGPAGYAERRALLLDRLAEVSHPRDLAKLPPNDLASSLLAEAIRAEGAFRADVSGAGPALYGLFHDKRSADSASRNLRRLGRTWIAAPAWYG